MKPVLCCVYLLTAMLLVALPYCTTADTAPPTVAPVTFSGTVVDDAGNPVSDLKVNLQLTLKDGGPWTPGNSTPTDKNGLFTIDGVKPGHYWVNTGYLWTVVSPTTFSVPITTPFKLVLKKNPTASLQGTVVDTAGKPISGATITFSLDSLTPMGFTTGSAADAISGGDGKYTLAVVPANASMIGRYKTVKDNFVYKSGGEIKEANGQIIVSPIVMALLGGTVEGLVHNSLGKPVANAWIYCPDAAENTALIQADAAGEFKLTNLVLGKITLYAAKGLYSTQCTADAAALPAITVVQLPAAPTLRLGAPNLPKAAALLTKNMNDLMSQQSHPQIEAPLDESAHIIAEANSDAAVKYFLSFASINTDDLETIVSARLDVDPVGVAQWALVPLQKMSGNSGRGRVAAEIGLAVAPYDLSLAKEYFEIASHNINLGSIDGSSLDTAIGLTSLAYALNRPEADDDYAKMANALDVITVDDKKKPDAEFITKWRSKWLTKIMAKGNVDKAIDMLSKMTPEQFNDSLIAVIGELVKPNPIGAIKVYHYIDNQNDPKAAWMRDRALCAVIPILYKSDPKGTLAKVEKISNSALCAQGLTDLADLMPAAAAAPLYLEAEDKSDFGAGINGGYTPECVAYHAWRRDKTLGDKLYKAAFESFVEVTTSAPRGQGASSSQFAFYYYHFDPAYCRLLLEKAFILDNRADMAYYNGDSADADAAAMAAIDSDRAVTMAAAITTNYRRYNAGLKVAQYVLLTPDQRANLPFIAWVRTSDWTPGNLTGN
jgi:hypothetical protein